jgi:hypothetical protein
MKPEKEGALIREKNRSLGKAKNKIIFFVFKLGGEKITFYLCIR